MSEVKKPEKIEHHPFCNASRAKHARCICDRKEYMRLNEHWEDYHDQVLAKIKAQHVNHSESLREDISVYCQEIVDLKKELAKEKAKRIEQVEIWEKENSDLLKTNISLTKKLTKEEAKRVSMIEELEPPTSKTGE